MLALLWNRGKPDKANDKDTDVGNENENENKNESKIMINEPTEAKQAPPIIRQNSSSLRVESARGVATSKGLYPARGSSADKGLSPGLSPQGVFPAPNSAQRASSSLKPPSGATPRKKVGLAPGHSPLDWANLNNNTPKHILRGVPPNSPPPQYIRVSKDQLKQHNSEQDCWTSINGKVFNITPYINFHPGGVDEIMKCAGRDGTVLFNKYHSWVNADRMLENCMIGMLVRD